MTAPSTDLPNWFAMAAEPFFRRHLLGRSGLSCLQIGAFAGHATEWLLMNVPEAHVTDVDPWTGSDEAAHHALDWSAVRRAYDERTGWAYRARMLRVCPWTSAEYFDQCATGERLDFAYIDGDHTAAAVLHDAVRAWELLKVGGLLAFDDYGWRGSSDPAKCPAMAIDAFLACYCDRLELVEKGWQVWVRKRV